MVYVFQCANKSYYICDDKLKMESTQEKMELY